MKGSLSSTITQQLEVGHLLGKANPTLGRHICSTGPRSKPAIAGAQKVDTHLYVVVA